MYYILLEKDTARVYAAFSAGKDCPLVGNGIVSVDNLPEGNVTEYLYKDGQFIYSPLPPDTKTSLAEQILDLNLRISELELETE